MSKGRPRFSLSGSGGWFPRLMVAAAGVQFMAFAVRPFLTYQAVALGADTTQIGIVTASFSAVSLVAVLPLGRAVDRYGAVGFVLAGGALLTAVSLLLSRAANIPMLAAFSAALGLGYLAASVGTQTLIAKGEVVERRDSRFATYTLVNSISQLVAPAAAGALVGETVVTSGGEFLGGSVYILAAAVGAASCAAVVTLLIRPGSLSSRASSKPSSSRTSFAEVWRTPSVPVALMASFTSLSSIDLLAAYLPAYGQQIGMSARTVGFLLAAHGLASVVARLTLTRLLGRISRRTLLTWCLALPASGLALLPFTEWVPGLFLIMALTGLGLGLCQPITLGWVAQQVRYDIRGTAMSVRLAGNRLGQTLVPLGVGSMAGFAGLAAAFVAPAVLLVASAALVARVAGEEESAS